MAATKRLVQAAGLTAGVIGVIAAAAPESAPARAARRLADRLTREVRYAVASAPGILYRLACRHPDPDVADDILADRIRSSIGPIEKRLDIPRVHVFVDDHVAIVHGEVPDARTAAAIERAILHVSGVDGIESHLHLGLPAGDTRPSEGATAASPSDARRRLVEAAQAAGARTAPRDAVHAVLCGFLDRLPPGERAHVLGQLPADVRVLAGPVRREGTRAARLRTVPQLVAAITAEGGVDPARADEITRAVLGVLHDLVRAEAQDVAAVLPTELRALWEAAPAQ
jgi:uncharacterized protein (DUF2267 family)